MSATSRKVNFVVSQGSSNNVLLIVALGLAVQAVKHVGDWQMGIGGQRSE